MTSSQARAILAEKALLARNEAATEHPLAPIYSPHMRISYAGSSLIGIVSIPSAGLDLDPFDGLSEAGRPLNRVENPDLLVAQYPEFGIVSAAGRVQLEAGPDVVGESLKSVAGELLSQLEPFRPRAVGFNVMFTAKLETGEDDPVRSLVAVDAFEAQAGGVHVERTGAQFIYTDQGARFQFKFEPDPEDQTSWSLAVNRHHDTLPVEGERDAALDWFATASESIEATLTALLGESEHDAVSA